MTVADYVLSAKGTYDGSDFDSGVEGSKSKLTGFLDAAKNAGDQVKKALGQGVIKAADGVTSAIGGIGAGVAAIAATGGISRALNMEQAKTMFKGLKLDWNDYEATISDAVDGTAFAMDAAALVAANLAASGVSAGEQMERSLNGATGVAATFGADLADIGGIYQKVAAQGKLSGEQLAQLSDRGINALSVLSEYLGKSQADVRDMVTKGKIDFQTFSDAMYETFGDSAKGANDTFAGVTANIRSNIAKIGEIFATPALGGLQRVFAALLPVIKSVRAMLTPLSASFAEWVDGVVPRAVEWLDNLRETIDGFGGDLSKIPPWVKVAAAAIGVLSVGAMGGLVSQIPVIGNALGGLFGTLGKLSTPVGTLTSMVSGLKGSFSALTVGMSGPMVGAFAATIAIVTAAVAAFAYLMVTNEGFRNEIMGLVGSIGSALVPAFQSLMGLIPVLSTTWNALKLVVMNLAPALLSIVAAIAPVVSTIVGSAIPIIRMVMGIISSLMIQITQLVTPGIQALASFISAIMPQVQQVISTAMQVIYQLILTVWPYIQAIVTAAMQAIQVVAQTVWPIIQAVIQAALAVIQALINVVMAAISGDWDATWEAIKTLASTIWEGIKSIVSTAISSVQSNLSGILAAISALWNSVWNAIKTLLSTVWNGIKSIVSSAASALLSTISGLVSGAVGHFNSMKSQVTTAVSSMWNSAKSAFSSGVSSVVSTVSGLPGKIKGFFAGAGSWLIESGRSIMSGLASGIRSGIQAAVDAASSAVSKVRSLFPFSPAKEGPFSGKGWVLYSGMSIMDALGEGASKEASRTVGEFRSIVGKVRDELDLGNLDGRVSYSLVPQGLPGKTYGNATALGPDGGVSYGDVTNIGDVTIDASSLEDLMTLNDFVNVLKHAKRSNPSRVRG